MNDYNLSREQAYEAVNTYDNHNHYNEGLVDIACRIKERDMQQEQSNSRDKGGRGGR